MTIRDIARIAGVSPATVSRALNDSPEISEGRKQQIRRIAAEHGFEFNTHARALSLQRNDTVGIVVTDEITSTAFIDDMVRLIRRRLERSDHDLIITSKHHLLRLVAAGKVSAVISMDPLLPLQQWTYMREHAIPCAAVHFRPVYVDHETVSSFYTDHEQGGYRAAVTLLEAGRRKLLCLTEGAEQPQFLARVSGFTQALKEYGLPVDPRRILYGECSYRFGYQSIMERKALLQDIDGICAHADVMAAGVMKALLDLGHAIPDDIAVVGYDDMDYTEYLHPGLTTVHQPKEQMAEDVCSYMLEALSSGQTGLTAHQYTPVMVYRESCRPKG